MMTKQFQGCYAAVVTPFRADESQDLEAVREIIEFQITHGVHGLLVGGTTGEYPMQTMEERKQLLKTAVEVNRGRVKIAACAGANTTKQTLEFVEYAGEVGADFVIVLAPFDMPTTERKLMDYYKEIAAFSKIPLIIYHYSAYTHVLMTPEMIEELANVKNIVGVKDVEDLYHTLKVVNLTKGLDFGVITGWDELFLPNMVIGADGLMGVGPCIMPEICRGLYDSYFAGDLAKAQEYHDKLCIVAKAVFDAPFPAGVKAAMELRGLKCGLPRRPLDVCSEEEIQAIRDAFVKVGIL